MGPAAEEGLTVHHIQNLQHLLDVGTWGGGGEEKRGRGEGEKREERERRERREREKGREEREEGERRGKKREEGDREGEREKERKKEKTIIIQWKFSAIENFAKVSPNVLQKNIPQTQFHPTYISRTPVVNLNIAHV